MASLLSFSIPRGSLLDSELLGVVILAHIYFLLMLFVAFVNIYSIDKQEYLKREQTVFEFKRRMFFIVNYSKNKHIISKKTFVLELSGYLIAINSFILAGISLLLTPVVACLLLGICAVIVLSFGCFVSFLLSKTTKQKS